MSKYLTFTDIIFKDRKLLLAALASIGFDKVEEGERLTLYGYRGDARRQKAEIVIRRQYLSAASNDIGFAKTKDSYIPIISDYDRYYVMEGQFLTKLRTAYNEHVAEAVRQRLRGRMTRIEEKGVIKIKIAY